MRRLGLVIGAVVLVLAARFLLVAGSGGAFTPPEPSAFTVTAAPEGGWVWFGGPRAVANGSETIAGYITGSSGGDVKAILIDNVTHTATSTTTLYDNFEVDDHDPPSFVVRPDGVIMAAFAFHLGELYVGIGPSPGVLPAQAHVTNITSQVGSLSGAAGYTYASILYLSGEDRYYIFARYHDTSSVPYVIYTYSDDDGVTWSARTVVQQMTYHHVVTNGTDRLDLVLSDHPEFGQGDDGITHTSIYHAYYDGTWHESDGTSLGSLPFGNTAATLVYDGTTSRGWLWDIAVSGGTPYIVYLVLEEPYATGPWRYEWARWTGSAWETHLVADAGGKFPTTADVNNRAYAGGIVLDHSNPSVVYYSSDAIGGQFQVYRAQTFDNGATWNAVALTSDSAKNVRPTSVRDHSAALQVLWLDGTYTDYFTYSQGIVGAGS